MTNRDFLNGVVNANISAEITEFATEQIAKLDERNARRKEMGTKNQQANAVIAKAILDKMEDNVTYTAANVAEMGIEGITSTQKASQLLIMLVDSGEVTSTDIKIKGTSGNRKVKGYTKIAEDADAPEADE